MQDRLTYPGNNDEEVIPTSILCNRKPADEPCDDDEGSEDEGPRHTNEHALTFPPSPLASRNMVRRPLEWKLRTVLER
jgi:hypothetical protein